MVDATRPYARNSRADATSINWPDDDGNPRPRNRRPLRDDCGIPQGGPDHSSAKDSDMAPALPFTHRGHVAHNRSQHPGFQYDGPLLDDSLPSRSPNRGSSPYHGDSARALNTLQTLRQGWASFRDITSDIMKRVDGSDAPSAIVGNAHISTLHQIGVGWQINQSETNSDNFMALANEPTSLAFDDILRNPKRKSLDPDFPDGSKYEDIPTDQMVYIHHVQIGDTYAGLTLKYRCHKDDIKRANGLWSNDNVQVRKWLAIPCDMCGIKGIPYDNTKSTTEQHQYQSNELTQNMLIGKNLKHHGTSSGKGNDVLCSQSPTQKSIEDENDVPWVHVRWVLLECFSHPTEVARISRRTLGYFPQSRRRVYSRGDVGPLGLDSSVKKNIRQTDGHDNISATTLGQPAAPSIAQSTVSKSYTQRPAWMRLPGGVGTLGVNSATPGPEGDYLNSWTRKHIPALNLDAHQFMPTSDYAGRWAVDHPGTNVHNSNSLGLDRAAAAVETWMRGAFTSLRTGTHISNLYPSSLSRGDLIELADTNNIGGGGNKSAGHPHDDERGPGPSSMAVETQHSIKPTVLPTQHD